MPVGVNGFGMDGTRPILMPRVLQCGMVALSLKVCWFEFALPLSWETFAR